MRRAKSCQLCHSRHKRCMTRKGASKCSECEEMGVECQPPPSLLQLRFSYGPPAPRRRRARPGNGKKPLPTLISPPKEVLTRQDDVQIRHQFIQELPAPPQPPSPPHPLLTPQVETFAPNKEHGRSNCVRANSLVQETCLQNSSLPTNGGITLSLFDGNSRSSFTSTASSGVLIPNENGDTDKDLSNACSPQSQQNSPSNPVPTGVPPQLSAREAALMRIYVQSITLSCDGCDNERHFATAVPKMAFGETMLLYGILALASRYEELRTENAAELESTYYHNKCLELLIEALSRPPETYGVSLLAAVVLSRLYEEYKVDQDTHFHHLNGTRNLLTYNAITRSAEQGGLAEAACWVHLHQAIYVSMVHSRQPIDLDIDVFETFSSLQKQSDRRVVNMSVYLLAKVIQVFFLANKPIQQKDSAMDKLEDELDEWWESIPTSFHPLREVPIDVGADRPFPSIWMLSSVQVMALEYHYAARVLVCLHRIERAASQGSSGFEAARTRTAYERTIIGYIQRLIGLAYGNVYFPGAAYMPSYVLSICGYLIKHPMERTHTIQLLKDMQTHINFRSTSKIVQSLLDQWEELDGFRV